MQRLTATEPAGDPAALAAEVMDRRLLRAGTAPLAVAFSGGGDSLALLLAARTWALAHGRSLVALTVDHQLQPQSRSWTEACAAAAADLAVMFQPLRWEGPKPATGLPAAARLARHRLLAQAARDLGARVLLMGHTRDDVLEARRMRAAGSATPEPREWAPSPVWPEGRGVFLLRPLLRARRTDLRAWLSGQGRTWIDDPANEDFRYARARARALGPAPEDDLVDEPIWPNFAELMTACRPLPGGGFTLPRAALASAPEASARRWLAAASLCAGGGARPPKRVRVERTLARARRGGAFVLQLTGARLEVGHASLQILREAGEGARGGLAPLELEPGAPAVWDGRFEVIVDRPGATVCALRGHMGRLAPEARRRLAELPAAARPALPLIVESSGAITCPLLETASGVQIRELAWARLLAASGAIASEPD